MFSLQRTNSLNRDFINLTAKLDSDLYIRYGDILKEYEQYVEVDGIETAIVAYEGDTAVGCGCFKHYADGTTEIKRVFVLPEKRNRGIGTLIMAELEKWAHELGYTNCILETGDAQPESVGLYTKIGYTFINHYRNYIGVERSICMQKELAMQSL